MEKRYWFSAPGRTELGGNHTDHQNGCVLAAAVGLETSAEVKLNRDGVIRVFSKGYPDVQIDLNDLTCRDTERGTTAALVRGIAAAFVLRGAALQGFDATVRSDVPPGSGLSSSAAFEVLMARIFNELFLGSKLDAVEIAKIGRWAENVYFGKPCGLMDQLASSVGGVIWADFVDPENPLVEKIPFDFSACGHALCIIDTGGDHASLTGQYAAITEDLQAVCACFRKTRLREVPQKDFYGALPALRKQVSDRAILRAIHIYEENIRVTKQAAALKTGDFATFLQLCRESGRSSWMYLQNIYSAGAVEQPMAVALALCHQLLGDRGAYRVHGGGFAGTVQAFVPEDMLDMFQSAMEAVTGKGSCRIL